MISCQRPTPATSQGRYERSRRRGRERSHGRGRERSHGRGRERSRRRGRSRGHTHAAPAEPAVCDQTSRKRRSATTDEKAAMPAPAAISSGPIAITSGVLMNGINSMSADNRSVIAGTEA